MKKFFLISTAVIAFLSLEAQKLNVVVNYVTQDAAAGSNNILYAPGELLSWSDFKASPVEGHDAAALSNAGFGIKLMFRRLGDASQLTIAVSCSFSRKDSWVKRGNKTTYILNHEQKHFDIAYISTMLFIQNLKKATFTNTNYAALIEKIYNESAQAMSDMQNHYDGETSHSRIPEKQAEWDEKVNAHLALVKASLD